LDDGGFADEAAGLFEAAWVSVSGPPEFRSGASLNAAFSRAIERSLAMPSTYLPAREADLVTWVENYNLMVQADAAACGLSLDQATAYQTAQQAFSSAYATANHPSTRTPGAIETKNTAKQAVIELTREYVAINQAYPGMTNTLRRDLGITVRDDQPTPVPVPEFAPQLDVVSVHGRRMSIRLRDSQTGERKKPEGVTGATLVSYVGETIPEEMRLWHFEGSTNRTDADIDFDAGVPMGAKVWIAAFWFNRKSESGPACAPVSAHVGFGALTEGESQAA